MALAKATRSTSSNLNVVLSDKKRGKFAMWYSIGTIAVLLLVVIIGFVSMAISGRRR